MDDIKKTKDKLVNQRVDTLTKRTCKQVIVDKTAQVLQGFVLELALGNTKYRSLHNLTEQVEHQYSERFLVELIQNAHDALFPADNSSCSRRIEIRVQKNDGPYGALYVANDGRPFSPSNFNSLSELGQSDKDPENSIGNKGIGFRSVLEISDSPEIYSREASGNKYFDGFCFRFYPGIMEEFEGPIQELLDGKQNTPCPFSQNEKLLPGGEELHPKLLNNCKEKEEGWLKAELKYLSPYLFPVPIVVDNKVVQEFERNGFATVIRLPFLDEKAYQSAITRLNDLTDDILLFLDRAESLKLVTQNSTRELERIEEDIKGDPEQGKEVLLSIKNNEEDSLDEQVREYWLWQEIYGGDDNSLERQEVKEAVAELPGKWPKLRKTQASFAVRLDDKPEKGYLNIYLPTKMMSGCHAHFSAPFYGDINRTGVNFGQDYNQLLLDILAVKVVKVIKNFLSGKGVIEAAAIIDLLAPAESGTGRRWGLCLDEAGEGLEVDFQDDLFCLSDQKWKSFNETRVLPGVDQHELITDSLLRQHANIPILKKELSSRKKQVDQLYAYLDVDLNISEESLSVSVEAIAATLHKQGDSNWNIFWQEVQSLFSNPVASLSNKKLLLGMDGILHSSGGETKVFFRPLRTGRASDDIPKALSNFIAFLHKDIITHRLGESGRLENTPVQKYLADNFVSSFERNEIVQGVLIRNTPRDFPIPYSDSRAALCQAIFQWGWRLSYGLIEEGEGKTLLPLLGRLPAPCLGGWYPLKETSFGPGWDNTVGALLDEYLLKNYNQDCLDAQKKLLKSPHDPLWEGMGETYQQTLREAGVFDGLRLVEVKPDEWHSDFLINGYGEISLPSQPPPGVSEEFWERYQNYIANNFEPHFSGNYSYKVQHFFLFPGFKTYRSGQEKSNLLLTELIFASISNWSENLEWKETILKKDKGEQHSFKPLSLLSFFLEQEQWIHCKDNEQLLFFSPSEKWYINSNILSGRSKQFQHLHPYPTPIRKLLDNSPATVGELQDVDMPVYNPNEHIADCRLLDSLAKAIREPATEIVNRSVFLGHLRDAWKQFYPEENSSMPQQLIVRQKGKLVAVTPSADNRPFLPNDSPAVHDALELAMMPVMVIDPKAAKRLQTNFSDSFDSNVLLASELTMLPVIDGVSGEWPVTGEALHECELEWLALIVLAVFAFAGEQSYGTTTKTFAEAIERMHRLRLCWVKELALGLWQGEKCISDSPLKQSAIKVPKKRIIVSVDQNKEAVEKLSGVLSSIVGRNDLEFHLKLVLNCLTEYPPDSDSIVAALAELRITREQFDEVQQLWLGEVSWTIQLLQPVLCLLEPETDISSLSDINSSIELEEFLAAKTLPYFSGGQLLTKIRNLSSHKTISKWLYDEIGDKADLEKYNNVLSQLGINQIKNDAAEEDFQEHIRRMQPGLAAIARHILFDADQPGSYVDLISYLKNITFPKELETKIWNVEFATAANEVAKIVEEKGGYKAEVDAIRTAKNLSELETLLTELGLNVDEDSIRTHSLNYSAYKKILLSFQQISAAWCVKNDVSFDTWLKQISIKVSSLSDELDPSGYLKLWDQEKCFAEIKKSSFSAMPGDFKEKLLLANDISNLPELLEISNDDIDSAEENIEKAKSNEEKKKRLVDVGGKFFDNSSENLGALWDHIEENLSDDSIPPVQMRSNILRNVHPGKGKGGGTGTGGGNGGSGFPGMTQSMKNLLGLAGEIFVYKALEKQFGSSIVNSSCWVSENAKHKFPGSKDVSDSMGCDFILKRNKKTYFIEVKATQGENTGFELGSSEVRLAIDAARKYKKERFVILHVINVLSDTPSIRTLPNPYHKSGAQKYNIANKGLRMTYKL